MMAGTLISAASQVLLKKAADKSYESKIREYLNPPVIIAYTVFALSTLCSVWAYKVVPLSMGPVIESTGYIFTAIFGMLFFQEKLTKRKLAALGLILFGIIIFSM